MDVILEFFRDLKHTAFSIGLNDIAEIIIMAVLLFMLFVWIRDTRAWFVLKGIVLLVLFFLVAEIFKFDTILYIVRNSLNLIILALIVVFQPELRSTLERLGKRSKLMNVFSRREGVSGAKKVTEEIIEATYNLANAQTGALIILERVDSISDYCSSHLEVDALVSAPLLENIFEHNTPLHDGAVEIRGDRILATKCILPLTKNPDVNKSLGTRHRAALGISEATDAIAIVSSEETGMVSVAVGGVITEDIKPEELRAIIDELIDEEEAKEKKSRKRITFKKKEKEAE